MPRLTMNRGKTVPSRENFAVRLKRHNTDRS